MSESTFPGGSIPHQKAFSKHLPILEQSRESYSEFEYVRTARLGKKGSEYYHILSGKEYQRAKESLKFSHSIYALASRALTAAKYRVSEKPLRAFDST